MAARRTAASKRCVNVVGKKDVDDESNNACARLLDVECFVAVNVCAPLRVCLNKLADIKPRRPLLAAVFAASLTAAAAATLAIVGVSSSWKRPLRQSVRAFAVTVH
jgi:hypothetical protein